MSSRRARSPAGLAPRRRRRWQQSAADTSNLLLGSFVTINRAAARARRARGAGGGGLGAGGRLAGLEVLLIGERLLLGRRIGLRVEGVGLRHRRRDAERHDGDGQCPKTV